MDHENFEETMRSFVSQYANSSLQPSLPLMVDDDPRQLTPILVEAALCFDERTDLFYDLWAAEVLQERIDRLEYSPDDPWTPEECEVLRTDIELSILTGLNDIEDLQEMSQWLARDPSACALALRGALSFLQGEPEWTIEQYE